MLLAQDGFQSENRVNPSIQNGLLDGIILSPRYTNPEKMMDRISHIITIKPESLILFDPMFYLANLSVTQTGELGKYGYYSDYPDMYSYTGTVLDSVVNGVIEKQKTLELKNIMLPTITINSFTDWTALVTTQLIDLSERTIGTDTTYKYYISLTISENALADMEALDKFINYLTLRNVKGFYINILRAGDSTAWYDIGSLGHFMYMINSLSSNGFEVHVGYSDFEGILFTLAGANSFASEFWKNTRILTRKKFLVSRGRLPKDYYSSGILLNHLNVVPDIDSIATMGELDAIFPRNNVFTEVETPGALDLTRANQVENMWKVFKEITTQIQSDSEYLSKRNKVLQIISNAETSFARLSGEHVTLSDTVNKRFPEIWRNAINLMEEYANMEV